MTQYENQDHNNEKYPINKKKTRNLFATASLIFGILSMINLCCFAFTTSIIFGVGAISLAIVSKQEQRLSTPAKIAVFLGSGSIVFGIAEYFYALSLYEYIKQPENIGQLNQIFEEAERLLQGESGFGEFLNH